MALICEGNDEKQMIRFFHAYVMNIHNPQTMLVNGRGPQGGS